jgi:hypothetical protein
MAAFHALTGEVWKAEREIFLWYDKGCYKSMYSYMRPTLGMVLLRLTIRCGDVFLTLNA